MNNKFNFDGRKSGEGKTFNYSVLSRSKSGDAKVQSSSKQEKESGITGPGGSLYYGKAKENNTSKEVLIEEIEIPLEEQNENKTNENKKTEKNIHSINKKKAIKERKIVDFKTSKTKEKSGPRNHSIEKEKVCYQTNIKSERKIDEAQLYNEEIIENKRKQSDLIIKKGKVFNIASNNQSKSSSPIKRGKQESEDRQSSANVSFSKNKRDLFEEKKGKDYKYVCKSKNTKEVKYESENYSNFLKQKELNPTENLNINSSAVSFKKKTRKEKLREGSGKRHKTPTHIDSNQKDMHIILGKNTKKLDTEKQSSRNEFIVYTSNTGGPNLNKDDFASEFKNQMRVQDYIQVNKGENSGAVVSSCSNKKILEKLASEDGS